MSTWMIFYPEIGRGLWLNLSSLKQVILEVIEYCESFLLFEDKGFI